MGKKLMLVIAIIVLSIIVFFIMPVVIKEIIADTGGFIDHQIVQMLNILRLGSIVILLFGTGKLIDYSGTASDSLKRKVSWLLYGGIILLFLPYLFMMVDFFIPLRYYSAGVLVEFINKTHINVPASFVLILWGIIAIWRERDEMIESPVFLNMNGLADHFGSLNKWGWTMHIILGGLIIGYILIMFEAKDKQKPEGFVVTIAEPGNLYWDPVISHKKPVTVERGDTITRIHRIQETRMLVTMADGSYGWYDITLISSDRGLDGYLFRSINTSDLKVSPDRDSKSIPEAERDGFSKRHAKNKDVRVLEMRRTERSYAPWAKVSFHDYYANTEITGWIPYSQVRINGQMHNKANYWIWIPLKWINTKLSDGFFAGLANVILIIIFISLLAFFITRFISTTMRFIPSFLLVLLIIITTIGLLYNYYFSFFDPSAFNWKNWSNNMGHLLYLAILLPLEFGIIKVSIQWIYEERCPECKYWEGYVLSRKLLSRSKETQTKIWGYVDKNGENFREKGRQHEIHVDEDWKDHCECGKCGNRWTLRRHERYRT